MSSSLNHGEEPVMPVHRRTAPRVVNGSVRRQNRCGTEPDYRPTHQVRIERYPASTGFRHYVSPGDLTVFLNLLPDWHRLSLGLQQVVLSSRTDCDGWCRRGSVAICNWPDTTWQLLNPDYYHDHADILARLRVPSCHVTALRYNAEHSPAPALRAGEDRLHCLLCSRGVGWYCDWYCLQGEADIICRDCGDPHFDALFSSRSVNQEGISAWLCHFSDASIQAFLLLHVLLHELGHHHDRMTSRPRGAITRGESYAEEYARKYEKLIWADYCRIFRFRCN